MSELSSFDGMCTGGMVSLVIALSFISLGVAPLTEASSTSRPTSMEQPPHLQSLPRKLGAVVGTMRMARNATSTSNSDEGRGRGINVDPTGVSRPGLHPGNRVASRREEAMMVSLGEQAGEDNKIREQAKKTTMKKGASSISSSSNNNLRGRGRQRRYDYKNYFTMDYLGVRRRRPIHNKSLPSSSSRSTLPSP